MFITIINDCHDDNTSGRQQIRLATLFPGAAITMVGIANYREIEAAGNMIDMLDASSGNEGVILVNSAPRHKKKWPNGTPFGYFWYKKTLVVATIDGYCLSLVKKFRLAKEIMLTDVTTVADSFLQKGKITKELRDQLVITQFRSFDYMPRLACWLMNKEDVPHETYPIESIPNAPKAIWLIDNFGNAKTTLLPEEVGFTPGKRIQTKIGEFTCYTQLRDVAVGEAALVIGSSGIDSNRFVEIIIMGEKASDKYHLETGMEIL